MKKRIASICLAAALVVSMLPATAMAAEMQADEAEEYAQDAGESTVFDTEVEISGTVATDDVAMADNDELFAEYVDRVFYGDSGIATFANAGPQVLDGLTLELYTQLKEMVTEVADGNRVSTVFSIDVDDFIWTAEELGITSLDEVYDALDEKILEMLDDVIDCLLVDCPYELYWYDKTVGAAFDEMPFISTNPDGTLKEAGLDSLEIGFRVEEAYQDPDSEDPDTTVNVAKTSAAQKAAANAQDIVADYAYFPTDRDKAVAYKEVICDLVSYDDSAAEDPDTPYGDPWQLIYVFDEDPETNVICEGYSKAFKYLCDMGLEDASAYLSVGDFYDEYGFEGSHMWNILNLDGCNYLVDVTNSDTGMIGEDGGLFLVDDTDAAYADPAVEYKFEFSGGEWVSYTYDDTSMYVFADDIRTLGSTYALTITQQPSDLALPVGYSDAALSVKATTDSGAIAYQWYQKDENGNGTPIEGATDSIFAIPDGMANGTTVTYYCTASQTIHHTGGDEDVMVTSDDAVVTVGETANGLIKGDDGKWGYYVNGTVDTSYNGFAANDNGKWYVVNGYVLFDQNTVAKDTTGAIGTSGTWYYVTGSKVQENFTGLANYKNENGWWYIKDGKVDFTRNSVDKNKNGWWYVTGGKVQFGFTGLANYKNENGWWYIEGGKVNFNHNGVDKNKNGWWYVTDSKVRFDFTGLANYKNANGWWYIEGGKVNFNHNGVDKNKNGWWYVKNSKVDFSYNGVAQNSNGWWYVNGGKVIFDDCLTYAAQFVGAHTKTSQSAGEKMQTCFTYMRSHYNYTRLYGTPTANDLPSYAVNYFKSGTGNCYSHASAVTCVAKVLGFETRTALGQIESSQGNGIMSAHGWCEVKVNGTWYICDVGYDVYMKTMAQYPRTLAVDNRYTLNITNGKAVWK